MQTIGRWKRCGRGDSTWFPAEHVGVRPLFKAGGLAGDAELSDLRCPKPYIRHETVSSCLGCEGYDA